MIIYNNSKPLISIHIPKSGGSSLRNVLKAWYGKNLLLHYYNEKDGKMPIRHELQGGVCVHGHFNSRRSFGIKDYYPYVNQFITFLRDPFELMLSRYFYVKKLEKSNKSFRNGYLLHLENDISAYISNVSLKNVYHPNILDYMPESFTFDNYKYLIEKYFIYIGITEDYQFCIDRLADKMGFERIKISHENQSERYRHDYQKLRYKFIKMHPLEYEIYNYILSNYRVW